MATVKPTTTIQEYQSFVDEVYGVPNDRHACKKAPCECSYAFAKEFKS